MTKKPNFDDTPLHCACFSLRKAARAVTQLYDDTLRPSGLRATQFSVLQHLASERPFTMSALADVLVTDRTTLTRNLKPLIERGLVKTEVGDDRRQRTVTITDEGEIALGRALPLWRQAQARIVDGLAAERWDGMEQDLEATVLVAQGE
jgi:DNA-binding MarR family transcriptional regulator